VFDEIVQRGARTTGPTWHLARPPIVGMGVEMDRNPPAGTCRA